MSKKKVTGPKFVTVLWFDTNEVSTIPAKHVINKDMLLNDNIVDFVEYPDGKSNPLPKHKAYVIQKGTTQKALKKTELAAFQLKIDQLAEQEKEASSKIGDDDDESENDDDDVEEENEDEQDEEEGQVKKKRQRSDSLNSRFRSDGFKSPSQLSSPRLDKSLDKSMDQKATNDNMLEGLNPQTKSPIKSPPSARSSDKSTEGIPKQGAKSSTKSVAETKSNSESFIRSPALDKPRDKSLGESKRNGGSPQRTISTHPKPQIDKFRRKFVYISPATSSEKKTGESPMETPRPSPVKSQKMSEKETTLDKRSLDKPSHIEMPTSSVEVSGIKKLPDSALSANTVHVLTDDQDVLFSAMQLDTIDVGALIQDRDKYKNKYLKEKAEKERLRRLNEQWQTIFINQGASTSQQSVSVGAPPALPAVKKPKTISEASKDSGLIKFLTEAKIEKCAKMGKTTKGGERFTIVTGHILLAVFGKETLLNSHNRDTTAKDEKGREPLDPEKRDAIIRFIRMAYSVGEKDVSSRISNKLRDLRRAERESAEEDGKKSSAKKRKRSSENNLSDED